MGLSEVEGARVKRVSGALLALVLAASHASAAQSFLVIVSGLGGDEAHRELFHGWAKAMRDTAVSENGLAEDQVFYLAESPEIDPEIVHAKSTKENVASVFESLKPRVRPGDQLFVLLIGHGSFRDDSSRINLPGRDLSAEEFKALLEPFGEQQVVFVNTTSASGGFAPVLAAPNRVIVTATKSGQERNEAQFGRYFVEAYAGDGADTDKNERVSIWEAFEYARTRVDGYYSEENLLKTEHALLDDNGDGTSSEDQPDGDVAKTIYLMGSAAVAEGFTEADVAGDPELARMVEQRLALEGRVEALKLQKSSMPEEMYQEELERLLLELAMVSAQIEAKRPQ